MALFLGEEAEATVLVKELRESARSALRGPRGCSDGALMTVLASSLASISHFNAVLG